MVVFYGYAALFGVEDLTHDVIEPGAFTDSIATHGADGIRMLRHHNPAEPIGRWMEIREDSRGLFVRGRLYDGVRASEDALAQMRRGELNGLSIGFRTLYALREGGIRRLKVILLREISLVTFPMQPDAHVISFHPPGEQSPWGFLARRHVP